MEGVSSAAIEVLVQNLINVIKEEYFLRRDLHQEANQLQKTLCMIQAYLNDAEKKSIEKDAVKIWLRELEAFAFDADNVLDELTYHLLHKEFKKMKVRSCFLSLNSIVRPRNMALRIKQINKDFECMNTRATDLGLQRMVVTAPAAVPHACFETDSLTLDPIFVGRDGEVSEIVKKLMTESTQAKERKFSILAIVGMGGMGKTTLTRKVFNHEKIEARFGSLVWVHVSQTFDPITLFKKILSILTSASSEGVESREVILRKLREALMAKTYLLVLDNVWNEEVLKWDDFINPLSRVTCTNGNGIIVTTRNTEVASTVRPQYIHTLNQWRISATALNGLSDEECWSIIKAKALDENGSSEFEVIGRKIARRCQGLPLAANVVGGVLFRCKSEQEWRSVDENWLSSGGESISKILRLSFDNLSPPSLKKCFAYCSVFPKGFRFKKQELIEQWMAEGFLEASGGNEEMETAGEKIINVLLHNSLLQDPYRDDDGNVWSCGMHDLVHDLATSCSVRALYMIHDGYGDRLNLIPKEVAKHLRTLHYRGEVSQTIFSDFESLRNLTLETYRVEFPYSIRKLIHLRNLDISKAYFLNLPEWIGELHHLQTLRADSGGLMELPSTLKYLVSLRHLYINSNIKLPAEIGRLTSLRTLTHFSVGYEKGYQIEELGSLNSLRGRLEIHHLEKVHNKEEALKANMYHKPNLVELRFQWYMHRGSGRDYESVLEGLQPHQNLKKLEIHGFSGKKFPLWSEKMAVRDNKLMEISLSDCCECEEIPMLGLLPNLKSLHLARLKKLRFINSSFDKLTKLHIERLEGLECLPDWLFYNNPNLSKVTIHECPKLSELPDGLHTLVSLEHLYIYKCPNLKSIERGRGGGGRGEGGGQPQLGILRGLLIEGCRELTELPRRMVESWAPSLMDMNLKELRSLQNLPMVIDCLSKSAAHLLALRIVGVPKLMASRTNSNVSSLRSLREAEIDVSTEWSTESSGGIKETVEGMLHGCCNSLTKLKLKGVMDWDWVPGTVQYLLSMERLELEGFGVEELPEWFGNLSSLRWLYLASCKKLRRLPPYKGLAKLQYLDIKDCPELDVDSEWRNAPRLSIYVDGRRIESPL